MKVSFMIASSLVSYLYSLVGNGFDLITFSIAANQSGANILILVFLVK
jgi:hypothetical protein